MEFDEDGRAEAIAAEWGVNVELLEETEWELETIDSNEGDPRGYFVRFDEGTDPEILAQLGVLPGQFYRELSMNAFDQPDYDPDDFELQEYPQRPNDGRRAYYIDEERFTPSQFRKLSRRRKVEAIVQWFHENYEDPAVRLPYESAEGGYQWIWGGPYDAREQIGDEFSNISDEDVIEAAVAKVTSDGLFDWAPKERREDYEHDEPDDGIYSVEGPFPDILNTFEDEDGGNQFPELPSGQAYLIDENDRILTDASGRGLIANVPISDQRDSEGNSAEVLRLEMLSRMDSLEALIRQQMNIAPNRGHNHPPELLEIERPATQEQLREVAAAIAEIRNESESTSPNRENVVAQASVFQRVARLLAIGAFWITGAAATGIIGQEAGLAYAAHKHQLFEALTSASDSVAVWVQSLPLPY